MENNSIDHAINNLDDDADDRGNRDVDSRMGEMDDVTSRKQAAELYLEEDQGEIDPTELVERLKGLAERENPRRRESIEEVKKDQLKAVKLARQEERDGNEEDDEEFVVLEAWQISSKLYQFFDLINNTCSSPTKSTWASKIAEEWGEGKIPIRVDIMN